MRYIMNLEEFKSLESKTEKIEFLLDYWKINKPILIGTVSSKKGSILWIDNVQSLDGEKNIKSPFALSSDRDMSVYCKIRESLESLEIGDNVIFSFDISSKEDKLVERPIVACPYAVHKLIDFDNSNINNKELLLDIIKEKGINSNIHKLLVQEEIENIMNNSLEDYKNNYNILKSSGEDDLKELELKKEKENKSISDIKEKISSLNNELKEKEELQKKFEEYGFNFENSKNNKVDIDVNKKSSAKKSKYIEYIQYYLAFREGKKLYYSKEILEEFYAGLCTNQLIVLSGQPGTGKTSLVEGFCDAIGAKLRIVSVQPNWTDNQDLLGFFNPIENTYIPTPFLDSLVEAEKNPDYLYIICLDEMNLAHVEYYFSEFLSKLQLEDKKITLYSDYLYKQAKEEVLSKIEIFIGKREEEKSKIEENIDLLKDNNFEQYYKLKKQWDSINTYKNEIKIPSNVRFVGTINKDETTKNLSPKVVDRSYIMEIIPYSFELIDSFKKIKESQKKKYKERLYLSSDEFKENAVEISKELKEKIHRIEEIFKDENIILSNRIYKQIEELIGSGIFREVDIYDAIVCTKILPKLNIEINDNNEEIVEKLYKELEWTSISKGLFENMKKYLYDSESGILTFWR